MHRSTVNRIATPLARLFALAALLGAVPLQSGGNRTRRMEAVRALSAARPDVNWDAKSDLGADFDCGGSLDEAFLGHAAGKLVIGLVRAGVKQPEFLEFGIGSAAEDAVCPGHITLAIESLDYDPTADVGKIEGFRRSRHCKGLLLSGGECDAIHIFWNYQTGHLSWWRL